VVGPSLGAQRYNPEVKVAEEGHRSLGELGERLRRVTRLIQTGLNWFPASASHTKEPATTHELPQDGPYGAPGEVPPQDPPYGGTRDAPYGGPRDEVPLEEAYDTPYDPYGAPEQHGYDHYGQPRPRHPDAGSGVWVDHDDEDAFVDGSGDSSGDGPYDDPYQYPPTSRVPPKPQETAGASGGSPVAAVVAVAALAVAAVAGRWQAVAVAGVAGRWQAPA